MNVLGGLVVLAFLFVVAFLVFGVVHLIDLGYQTLPEEPRRKLSQAKDRVSGICGILALIFMFVTMIAVNFRS